MKKSKRLALTLTPRDFETLEILSERLGESKNQVIRRALIILYENIQIEDNKINANHN